MTSSASAPTFGRMLTAMATAFHDDGSVDLDGTARIAAHLVDHGHDGVVVSGTTGESPTTTVSEDGEILRAVVDAVGDRAAVVAGVGTNATAHSVELARQAEKLGADGLLLVTPYYNKPGQAGVLHHFRTVVGEHRRAGHALRRAGPHGDPDRARDLRRRQGVGHRRRGQGRRRRLRARGADHASSATTLYSGDDAANLGWLAHGAQRRGLGGRPRGRRPDRGHDPRASSPATTTPRWRRTPGCCRRPRPS